MIATRRGSISTYSICCMNINITCLVDINFFFPMSLFGRSHLFWGDFCLIQPHRIWCSFSGGISRKSFSNPSVFPSLLVFGSVYWRDVLAIVPFRSSRFHLLYSWYALQEANIAIWEVEVFSMPCYAGRSCVAGATLAADWATSKSTLVLKGVVRKDG